ncbi:MAG: alpha/beta fold hydrolase [Thermoanaerobaculia bacterium]
MSISSVAPERVVVEASDGQLIEARFYTPFYTPEAAPRGAVLLVPAMGTTQSYYAPFAAWLAAQGFLVATFDYRGTGASRTRPLRGFVADIVDWARLDCAAMVEAISRRSPGLPLNWLGHSLGGQILPFVPNVSRVARIVTIAAGSGYWRENTPALRRRVWWLWFFVVPVALAVCGYFPGRRLRKVGDLPKGVMAQWRRWCLDPEYAVGAEGEIVREQFARIVTPIISLSFVDDELMSAENIRSLHGFYTGAPRTMTRIAPADVGARRIGHFGFFRAEHENRLWRDVLLPELI